MSWKEDIQKGLDDEKQHREYLELIINQLHQRLFYTELALKSVLKIITIKQKFVTPKEYTTITQQVYKEMEEEAKKRAEEEALEKAKGNDKDDN